MASTVCDRSRFLAPGCRGCEGSAPKVWLWPAVSGQSAASLTTASWAGESTHDWALTRAHSVSRVCVCRLGSRPLETSRTRAAHSRRPMGPRRQCVARSCAREEVVSPARTFDKCVSDLGWCPTRTSSRGAQRRRTEPTLCKARDAATIPKDPGPLGRYAVPVRGKAAHAEDVLGSKSGASEAGECR